MAGLTPADLELLDRVRRGEVRRSRGTFFVGAGCRRSTGEHVQRLRSRGLIVLPRNEAPVPPNMTLELTSAGRRALGLEVPVS